MVGHDPMFQKSCSLLLPLFRTNRGGEGQETIFTTKISAGCCDLLCEIKM